MPRPRHEPHEFDKLTFEQLIDVAEGHDLAGWVSQGRGFVELRDLATNTATTAERALSELRESWSGAGAEAFATEFAQILALLGDLRDSSASNADGMREMALIMRDTREEAELLRSEDKDWTDNPEGDSSETISNARKGIRDELRDKLKDAEEAYQHLSSAYLLPPPEPPRLTGMESIAFDNEHPHPLSQATDPSSTMSGHSGSNTAPSLQNASHAQPAGAPPAEPVPSAAPPPAEPAPVMPMSGVGMAGDVSGGSTSGGRTNSGGPTFAAPQNVPPSRMRSESSRQHLHNQAVLGETPPDDPTEKRRAVHADDDSPFIPAEPIVVPPVITSSTPFTGPHDSGPVVANTIPQRFPEYGYEERLPDIAEEYEDGSSVEVVFDAFSDDASPPMPLGTASKPVSRSDTSTESPDSTGNGQ